MIHHIVWWTLKEEALGASAQENAQKMAKMLNNLMGKVEGLHSLQVTTALMPSSTITADIVLQTTHKTKADLQSYIDHPLHQDCVTFIKQIVATRQAIDYEM